MTELTPGDLRRGYGPIYRRLSRCGDEISTSAKLVFINLLEHLGQNGKAWPRQSLIATECGISERQVRIALNELVDRGFVCSTRRGLGKSNEYELDISLILRWCRSRAAESAAQERQTLPLLPIEDLPKEDPHMKAAERQQITKSFREEMRERYPDLNEQDEYERAINHTAYTKARNKRIYYQKWIARADQWRRERQTPGGNHGIPQGRAPEDFLSPELIGRGNVHIYR